MTVSPIAFRHNLSLPPAPAHAQARGPGCLSFRSSTTAVHHCTFGCLRLDSAPASCNLRLNVSGHLGSRHKPLAALPKRIKSSSEILFLWDWLRGSASLGWSESGWLRRAPIERDDILRTRILEPQR